ncbi:hypothetical protein SCLCIDRAFT_18640 [Scleroderma citrinum Foug A]|uniref:Uncharacterized protein n=1 Tax=Scleroderma citrinum Foug A TaxID=1036808 RepID=A0A0C3ERT0_9AGAM|nr:hypothetical protein SCLCIDRAFT_18640 [Scleroderma citrinum Foug A]
MSVSPIASPTRHHRGLPLSDEDTSFASSPEEALMDLTNHDSELTNNDSEPTNRDSELTNRYSELTNSNSKETPRRFLNPWPRIVGTNPLAHSRLLNKGKAPESKVTEHPLAHRFSVKCPEIVEDTWWKLLYDMADLDLCKGGFQSPWDECE